MKSESGFRLPGARSFFSEECFHLRERRLPWLGLVAKNQGIAHGTSGGVVVWSKYRGQGAGLPRKCLRHQMSWPRQPWHFSHYYFSEPARGGLGGRGPRYGGRSANRGESCMYTRPDIQDRTVPQQSTDGDVAARFGHGAAPDPRIAFPGLDRWRAAAD